MGTSCGGVAHDRNTVSDVAHVRRVPRPQSGSASWRNRARYAAELEELLSRDEVSGRDFVYGELLIGDRGGPKGLLANYERKGQAPLVPHAEVVTFVVDRKLNGPGVGWIDAHLIASALVGRLKLWTVDSPLGTVATELGIAYE